MFKNLKLSRKMGVGFGLLILIAAILGANGWWGLARMARLTELVKLSGDCMEDMLNCRRQEKNFQLRGFAVYGKDKKNSADKWEDDFSSLSGRFESIRGMQLASSQREILENIPAALQGYHGAFRELIEARRMKDEAFAAWRRIGWDFTATINDTLAKVVTPSLAEAVRGKNPATMAEWFSIDNRLNTEVVKQFLTLRVTAIYLIATNADEQWASYDKQLAAAKEGFVQWGKLVAANPELKGVSDKFSSYLAEYEAAGQKYHEAMLKEKGADAILVSSAREVGARLDEFQADLAKNMSAFIVRSSMLIGISLLLGVGAAIILAVAITRSITRPIDSAISIFEEMGKGRLHQRLRMEREDEIGRLARSMDNFADTLEREVVTSLKKMAVGDFTFTVTPYDQEDVIGTALKQTTDDLNRLVGEISGATDQIAAGASQVADTSQALSQGATEQAAAVEEINSSMVELGAQTKSNAENASLANRLAGDTREAAENGEEKMQDMMAAMIEISEAGQSINKIIKVIDEIAFQTNLLALNAAVEAARAGRHGKGFAVVAEEVRNLAARSATAAKETAELIEGSVRKTENGSVIARGTAEALLEIVGSVAKVTDLVGEIAAASSEQAQGIAQVNQGLGQIDQVTQQNTASAEEGAAASEELSAQAAHLKDLVGRFKVKDLAGRRETVLGWNQEQRD